MSQTELARQVGIDRTTLNKIERESRSDVSISQLFRFAEALHTSPIYLLTPRLDDARVQITEYGRVLAAAEFRQWLRGEPPAEGTPETRLAWFLALPRDEQVGLLRRQQTAGMDPLVVAVMAEEIDARSAAAEEALDQLIKQKQEAGAAPRKLRSRKERTDA